MTNNENKNHKTPVGAPFRPAFPVRSLADIHRLEETPLEQALTVRSTYEIFRNAVVKAPADGYTILLSISNTSAARRKLSPQPTSRTCRYGSG